MAMPIEPKGMSPYSILLRETNPATMLPMPIPIPSDDNSAALLLSPMCNTSEP